MTRLLFVSVVCFAPFDCARSANPTEEISIELEDLTTETAAESCAHGVTTPAALAPREESIMDEWRAPFDSDVDVTN